MKFRGYGQYTPGALEYRRWCMPVLSPALSLALLPGMLLSAPSSALTDQPVVSEFRSCPPQYEFPKQLAARAKCATVAVPENRDAAKPRILTLPIVKFPALDSTPSEPVFVLNGGPGDPNLNQISPLVEVSRKHTVYYLGYRGAEGSTVLQCPEINAFIDMPQILSSTNLKQIEAASGACARRLQQSGIDLAHYTILDVIDDLESVRAALGYDKINLFSISYGTRVAQYYARRHPERIFRSVMSGTNPPGHFVFDARVHDQILNRLSQLCAHDVHCASRTRDLRQTALNALHVGAKAGNNRIDDGKTQLALFLSMYQRKRFGMFFDAAVSAEKGDLSGLDKLAQLVTGAMQQTIWGDLMTKGILDSYGYAAKQATFAATNTSMGSPLDQVFQALTKQWPSASLPAEYRRAVDDQTQTLIMNGDIDIATPLPFVRAELMPHLPNGKLLVLKDYGHSDPDRQLAAFDRIMAIYYDTGQLDSSALRPDPYVFQR